MNHFLMPPLYGDPSKSDLWTGRKPKVPHRRAKAGTAADKPAKPRRRNPSSPGTTASLSIRRRVEFVVQAIKHGRGDSATALACLSGAAGPEVRFGVWRRAKRNPWLALALDDEWKRGAVQFEQERIRKRRGGAGATLSGTAAKASPAQS